MTEFIQVSSQTNIGIKLEFAPMYYFTICLNQFTVRGLISHTRTTDHVQLIVPIQ